MENRKILVSPYQLGGLSALNKVFEFIHATTQKGTNPLRFDSLVYTTMIQSGATEIQIDKMYLKELPPSSFLRKRVAKYSGSAHIQISKTIDLFYEKIVPPSYPTKIDKVAQIKYFLTDLLFAANNNSSIASVFKIPNPENLGTLIPKEMILILQPIFNSMKMAEVKIPIPKSILQVDEVKRFEELVNSDLFLDYSHSHLILEDGAYPMSKAISEIENMGRKLLRSNESHFNLKKISLGVLPLTVKIAESFIGKISEKIGDGISKLISDEPNRKRQIAVYTFQDLFVETLKSKVKFIK